MILEKIDRNKLSLMTGWQLQFTLAPVTKFIIAQIQF